MGKPYAKEGPSAEDKALDLFADMMIERIQSLSGKDEIEKARLNLFTGRSALQ